MRLRRLFRVGTVMLLVFCVQEVAPTLMLTSMLMAVKSGLMVGKMSLGGLVMMLMAANQQNQQASTRQNTILKQTPLPFDILSLMSASHSNNVPVTVTSSPHPAKLYSGGTTLATTTTPIIKVSRRRVFKKKVMVRRDLSERPLIANDNNETTAEENEIKDSPTLETIKNETITNEIKDTPTLETILDDTIAKEIKKVLSLQKLQSSVSRGNGSAVAEEKEVNTRIFRQISNLDPLMCLPKVMCGINTAPPSKKTNILNDYAYLMKTIFSRDDDDDDKKPVTKNEKSKKKKKKGGNKKKNDDYSDESNEDDFVLNDDDFERLALKEEADIENLAQHEMADEEPGFLPYILKDANHMPDEQSEQSETNQDYPADDIGHEEGGGDYPNPSSGRFPYRGPHHSMPHQREPRPGPNHPPGSMLSSFIPKISFGKNKGGKDDAFSSDPFFDGFKRSINLDGTDKPKTLNITKEQDQLLKEIKMRRDKRNIYVMRKKKQIEMTTDPEEKFRIAAEVGRRTKSARQCRALFNECPFKYTEVLSMISNLRNAVQGQMENTADKVVTLVQPKTPAPSQIQVAPAASNVINVNTGDGGVHGGITSISHQMPNGEKIEINLKVVGKATTESPATTVVPKTKKTVKVSIKPQNVTAEKIFDDDDEATDQPLDKPTTQNMKKQIHSLESLESLKATLMAIEKINNATINRKKYGKPITYSGIFHEVTGIGPVAPVRVQNGYSNNDNNNDNNESADSSGSNEDDEEDEDLPTPPPITLQQQNSQDFKRPFPLRPQIRPQLRPQFHDNRPQKRIRPRSTTPTTTIPSTTVKPKPTTKVAIRKKTPFGLRPTTTKPKGYKISQKDDPFIVPFTEKENIAIKHKVPTNVTSSKKKPSKGETENSDDYDEGDIDGDDNENDTSEEEEDADDELKSDESTYMEQRLNIQPQSTQSDSDDEDDESEDDRVVIKQANPQQHLQMPQPPPQHSHPQNQQHPSHQQNQPRPPHPHSYPQPPHPHSPPQPPHSSQHLPQLRPTFHHRNEKVSKSRTKRSRFPTNRRTVKRKHPNHRYPCSAPIEATTPSTDNLKNHSLEDRQPVDAPSTLSPPTLPIKYPQYRSPHKM